MAECHFVHQNGNIATDFAVLGFLFEASSTSNDFLAALNLGAATLRTAKAKKTFELDLGAFFSSADLTEYYNYEGSLTTPACSEVVEWVLFKNPNKAITTNVGKMKLIKDSSSPAQFIKNNWRRPQAIGSRTVNLVTVNF